MDNFQGSRGSSHEAQGWLGRSGCCWNWIGTVGIDASQMLFLAQRGVAFGSSVIHFMSAPSVWSLTGVRLFGGSAFLGLASVLDLDRAMGSSSCSPLTSGLTQWEKNVILFSSSASGGSGKVELQ